MVPFQVDADDDHRDLVVAVKGKSDRVRPVEYQVAAGGEHRVDRKEVLHDAAADVAERHWVRRLAPCPPPCTPGR